MAHKYQLNRTQRSSETQAEIMEPSDLGPLQICYGYELDVLVRLIIVGVGVSFMYSWNTSSALVALSTPDMRVCAQS